MRILGRSLILLCLILFTWYVYSTWVDVYQKNHLDLATPYPNVIAERNDVYLLSESSPKVSPSNNSSSLNSSELSPPTVLSFRLNQRIERLQIAAMPLFQLLDANPNAFSPLNVDIMRQQNSHPKYSIEYTLLDEKSNILSSETYWFNAKPTPWVLHEKDIQNESKQTASNQENTVLVPEFFLSDENYYAGTRQSIYLRMGKWPTARKLELRMSHQPNELAGASVYVREYFSRTKEEVTALWRKLSDNKRTRYTENVHMYPHYIWSSSEIDSLLSNYWKQIGPEGIVGEDFTTLGLYRAEGIKPTEEPDGANTALPSSALLISENNNLTFPIHSEGEVQLSFRPLQASALGKILILTLHPFDASTPIVFRQFINQTTSTWKGILPKGLLELSAEPALEIEIQKMPDELTSTHKQHLTRYYWVSADKPLTYPIEHWRGQATPVKIELRAIINQHGLVTAENAIVKANWLATDKATLNTNSSTRLNSHQLSLDYQASRYEHFSDAQIAGTKSERTGIISEEKSAYYLAPTSINQLQITSTSPVLVQVSSRPFELPLVRTVPSHNRGWFDDESYLPTWFSLRPEQHHILINQGDSALLRTQHRPLLDRYSALDKEFIGEQIPPNQGQLILNEILIPTDDEDQLTTASPARRYRQFSPSNTPKSGPVKLNFINDNNSRSLSPSLVFQSKTRAPREVTITLDNQDIHSQWISGNWGEITLPKIAKGLRTLSASGFSDKWFVNHIDYIKGARYWLLKEAFSLREQRIVTYTVNKKSSETLLNFTYYQELTHKPIQGKIQVAALIEVKILNTQKSLPSAANATASMSTSMTIPIRHWRLIPDLAASEPGLMLNRGNRKTTRGTHFVYSLSDDLPAGEYQIQFSLLEGSAGYLNVSRLIPKPGTEIDYFRESIHAY
jgi:hypothetical protein